MHRIDRPPVLIALVFDEPYAPHAGTLVQSILEVADPRRDYRFVFFGPGLSNDTIRLFSRQFAPFANASFQTKVVALLDWVKSPLFPPVCVTRLKIPGLLAEAERILYLDVDMIAKRDVAELFDIDLKGALFAAVRDWIMESASRAGEPFPSEWRRTFGARLKDYHRDYLGMPSSFAANYVNAGMLVIDAEQWRRDHWEKQLEAYCRSKPQGLVYNEQDALNVVARGRILHAEPAWNRMNHPGKAETTAARDAQEVTPAIIHYTHGKPWDDGLAVDAEVYWAARDRSPFAVEGGYMKALSNGQAIRFNALASRVERLERSLLWLRQPGKGLSTLFRRLIGRA
jgi:lipopolysaccharide biosynthesis glycosyltransferase